jgi:hypothetical protein
MITIDNKPIKLQIWDTVGDLFVRYTFLRSYRYTFLRSYVIP